jgi:hypothetical protein
MKHPPMLMYVRIRREDGGFCLWLPLFLLLPLALVLLIILSPLILLAVVILWLSGRGKRAILISRIALSLLCSMRFIGAAVDLLCSMPGLRVDITGDKDQVRIFVA